MLNDDFFSFASATSFLAFLSLRKRSFVGVPRATPTGASGDSVEVLAAARNDIPGKRVGLRTVFQCQGKIYHVRSSNKKGFQRESRSENPRSKGTMAGTSAESQIQKSLASVSDLLRQGGISSPLVADLQVAEGP